MPLAPCPVFQIFTRVCATLNTDVMNFVPGSREVLLDHLNQEENSRLGIDEQQHFTLEASLATITRVHNCLKDLLNLPACTRLTLSSDPADPPPKKTEERSASCRLLLPFVSSKGRHIKLPSHLPAVMNYNDAFHSDDSDYEVKPTRHKRKGRPRKLETCSSVVHRNTFRQSNSNSAQQAGDFQSGADFHGEGVASSEKVTEASAQGENSPANDLDPQGNVENIADPLQRPGGRFWFNTRIFRMPTFSRKRHGH